MLGLSIKLSTHPNECGLRLGVYSNHSQCLISISDSTIIPLCISRNAVVQNFYLGTEYQTHLYRAHELHPQVLHYSILNVVLRLKYMLAVDRGA